MWVARCRKALSLKEAKSLTRKGEKTGRVSWHLRSVTSPLWAYFLHFQAALFSDKECGLSARPNLSRFESLLSCSLAV